MKKVIRAAALALCALLTVGSAGAKNLIESKPLALPAAVLDRSFPAFHKQGNTLIFMYHSFVSESEMTPDKFSTNTSPEKFRRDIKTLLDAGYQSIPLERYYRGETEPGKNYFIITLDDGYKDNYEVAYPILSELNVYGDIFANTGVMGGLPNHLTWSQCQEMERSGWVRVYSHLPYHQGAVTLGPENLTAYVRRGTASLEQYLGKKDVQFISYPYGQYNRETFDLLSREGIGFQLVQGAQFENDNLLVRLNAPYNVEMSELMKKAPKN